ncbi:hypothetical protein [Fimbriimonas ginsengisoli]|uniref:Uncharacterized protein n=1 Tax=Fimbriimonas ginsengisoli Gsoil 348 TaxID=661478 RepID=A0A068NV53_FIMGI|nr:hypothetical protein [Fimbriimonas ginsengisoli]AIE87331.1 hypothetical protein OP10G_3963 [Fimbriimonas ginsengisoli Gsoil 348]
MVPQPLARFPRPFLLILVIVSASTFLLRGHTDVSDFSRGVVTGIWLGLLALAVIAKAKSKRSTP